MGKTASSSIGLLAGRDPVDDARGARADEMDARDLLHADAPPGASRRPTIARAARAIGCDDVSSSPTTSATPATPALDEAARRRPGPGHGLALRRRRTPAATSSPARIARGTLAARYADRTLVICKPDAVERGLVGEILGRFERRASRIAALELRTIDEAHPRPATTRSTTASLLRRPRGVHRPRGPVVHGASKVRRTRGRSCATMMGATNPRDAAPGTIRGDLGIELHGEPGPRQRRPGVRTRRSGSSSPAS